MPRELWRVSRLTMSDVRCDAANTMKSPVPNTSNLLRHVMETYSAQIVRVAGGLVFGIWITRLLSPSARGYYGVAITVAVLATQFGQLGVSTANTYYAARDPRLGRTLLGNSLLLTLIIAPCLILLTLLIVRLFPSSLVIPRSCLLFALCYIPFALGYNLFQGQLLGSYEIRTYNLLEVANRYIPLGLLLVWVMIRSVTAASILGAIVIAQAIACLWALIRLYFISRGLNWSAGRLRPVLRYGVRIHVATIFSFLLIRADLLMVAQMRGATEAGYYSVAASMADYLTLPATLAGSVLLPYLSALPATLAKFRLMSKWLLGMAAATAPLLALTAFAASPLVRWLFGARYAPTVAALLWLLPGVYFLGLASISVQFITSIGYKLSVPAAWLGALLLNIAGNLYAIPRYGFTGASILSSVCYAACFLAIQSIAWRHRNERFIPSREEYASLLSAPEASA